MHVWFECRSEYWHVRESVGTERWCLSEWSLHANRVRFVRWCSRRLWLVRRSTVMCSNSAGWISTGEWFVYSVRSAVWSERTKCRCLSGVRDVYVVFNLRGSDAGRFGAMWVVCVINNKRSKRSDRSLFGYEFDYECSVSGHVTARPSGWCVSVLSLSGQRLCQLHPAHVSLFVLILPIVFLCVGCRFEVCSP